MSRSFDAEKTSHQYQNVSDFLNYVGNLVIIATEQFKEKSYKLQREDLAIQVATASVRLSRAMIKPAGKGDVETIEAILSAFAGSPEIRCVNLNLRKGSISLNWPDEKCTTANPDTMLHKQPIRRGVRVMGKPKYTLPMNSLRKVSPK